MMISFLLASMVAYAGVDPGLVTVSSLYRDQKDSTRQARVRGTGFLVKDGDKTLVLTASHVSQGEDTQVVLGAAQLPIVGRYYDGVSDVEALEVTTTTAPTVVFDGNYLAYADPGQQDPPRHRARFVDRFNWVLLNDWTPDWRLEEDNRSQEGARGALRCAYHCDLLSASTLVQPGASGSPLITRVPNDAEWGRPDLPVDLIERVPSNAKGRTFVRGMAVRRDRFFARSNFVPAKNLLRVLADYRAGKRGGHGADGSSTAAWKLAGPLLYRVTGSGTEESQVISGSSGNGFSMDGGDGIASLHEDSPKAVLSQISAYPVEHDHQQGYFWMLMQRDPFTSALIQVPIWFDMEHYLPTANFTFGMSSDRPPGASLLFTRGGGKRDGAPVTLVSADKTAELRLTPSSAQVIVKLGGGARLELAFDANGALCSAPGVCDAGFLPIQEVRATNGEPYVVDLRSLFTLNPAASNYPALSDPKNRGVDQQAWLKVWNDAFLADLRTLRLFFRKQREGQASAVPLSVEQGQPKEIDWVTP